MQNRSEIHEAKEIRIISSHHPNGITWLVNCLLELGFCCYPGLNLDSFWKQEKGETYFLQSKALSPYQRWLPNLRSRGRRFFRPDYRFSFSHDWPSRDKEEGPVILMARNPKGSLYSAYRRLGLKSTTYMEFVKRPDPEFLISTAEYVNLFYTTWHLSPHLQVLRFEDTKTRPLESLKSVLDKIDVSFVSEDLNRAITGSTSEKAQFSEVQYLRNHHLPLRHRVSRAGSTDEWKSDALKYENEIIDKLTVEMQTLFGYDLQSAGLLTSCKPVRIAANKRQIPFPSFVSVGQQISDFPYVLRQFEQCKVLRTAIQEGLPAVNSLYLLRRLMRLRGYTVKSYTQLGIVSLLISLFFPVNLVWQSRSHLFRLTLIRRFWQAVQIKE